MSREMERLARRVREAKTLEEARRVVAPVLARAVSAARRKAAKTKPRRDAEARKRDRAWEEGTKLRELAIGRCEGLCELCGLPPLPLNPLQLAHLDGGSGKRRPRQWIGNVLMAHLLCHQGSLGIDTRPTMWIGAVGLWAARHGYPMPARFQKLEALRKVNE